MKKLCSATLTVAFAGLCVCTITPNSNAGLLDDPDLTGITVYETTGGTSQRSFSTGDARLISDISQDYPDLESDFATQNEYYDVFVSDCNGALDPSGNCVTIECYHKCLSAPCYGGNNIDAVRLDYASGPSRWATVVMSYSLGNNIDRRGTDSLSHALGAADDHCTYVGGYFSRITLGFNCVNDAVVVNAVQDFHCMGDLDCDGFPTSLDLGILIDILFAGESLPTCPAYDGPTHP